MRHRRELPAAILALADERHGAISRAELLAAGLSRHSIARLAASWRSPSAGIYLIDGRYDEWLGHLNAGMLMGGSGSAAWGATALALWRMGERPTIIEVLTNDHRTRAAPWLQFRRDPAGLRRRVALTPARVSLEDAVIDSAARGSEHYALAIVGRALQESRTTSGRLTGAIESRPRLRHRKLLMTAIGESAAGAHSALEHLYVALVERAHRLPPMRRQYVVPETGHTADGAHERLRLLVELDGVRFHDRDADRALDNRHASLGYRTFRYDWPAIVGAPCDVATQLATVLGVLPRACPRCRAPS